MKIAVEGCCHGALDAIYRQIATLEQRNNYKVDLLVICGDFQAIRNVRDLQCMAVPDKYKQLGEFHKYYTGERIAPVLTIVIGGNHEASNYFWELYHGGWIAPNMYFMGHAGCVQVSGIRIAGASGIFKSHDFRKGHYERLPYDHGTMRSIYHIREYNVRRLSLLSSPDIFLSHDWPQSIEQHGDVRDLLRRKRFFTEDVNYGRLGSPPLMGLLRTLQPKWWFSAHLHTRFEATVIHGDDSQGARGVPSGASAPVVTAEGTNPDEIVIDDGGAGEESKTTDAVPSSGAPPSNPDEIKLDDEEEEVASPPLPPPAPSVTNFLALDKCLPGRQFLEVIDIPTSSDNVLSPPPTPPSPAKPTLQYDPEWLAITRAFDPYFSLRVQQLPFPEEAEARAMVAKELAWVEANLNGGNGSDGRCKNVQECQQFVMTAPGPGAEGGQARQQPPAYRNPQTDAFCTMLSLQCKINAG
ncbi:DBR1-domain-containing protein [Pleurotus eryngii]|uniref:DBR1-domain-containing protein n=1 Tax=Pleurotus eryngii TaxID=5323 RepID=A0A9P6DF97_PLEER|nr:DBR1-domain-containing protein [Pleurotus eryngii]